MEFHRVPNEFAPLPEEYRMPAEPVDQPGEEFSPRPGTRKSKSDRHRLIRRLMLVPLAAAVASTSLWLASFNADPLGAAAQDRDPAVQHDAGTQNEDPNEPQGEPAENESAAYEIHVTYTPTGESRAFPGETEEQALTDARAWISDVGGDPDSLRLVREEKFLVDTIYSDDCIIVGDPDDMEHAYIAQGTVTYVYRWEFWYEAFDSAPDDAFPVLPNLDPDFAGRYAWAGEGSEEYVALTAEGSGEYVYLHAGEYYRQLDGFALGTLPGASYDRNTNTLTLENFSGGVLDVNLMGNGFTIRLIGENHLRRLMVWGAMYGGSVTFTGEGSLVINGGEEPAILLNAEESQTCLMVDHGVTVEAYSDYAAIIIFDTTMDPAVYCRRGVTVTGGEAVMADQTEIDGTTYYTHTMVDEDGNLATYVRFSPE